MLVLVVPTQPAEIGIFGTFLYILRHKNNLGVSDMKNRPLFAVLLCLVLPVCMLAQPKIGIVQGTSFDFGDISNTHPCTHDVTVKNTGTDTLHIKNVRAQCGCTTTGLSEMKLAPSDTSKLTITFNPSGYPTGPVTKHVYVESDDPKTPMLTIEFVANIAALYKLDPGMFTFNNVKADSVYTKVIMVTNMSKVKMKLTGVSTKMDMIKATLKKTELNPGEQTELEAVFHPGKSGTYPGVIELTTDHPQLPKIEVRVYGWVTKK